MEMENTDSRDSQDMLSLRHVRVRYGEVEILHGITFDVKRGETLVILGGSGSGKSTLLRALVGLEKPSSGEIWIKGKNIAAISEHEMEEIRKKIGMSFQGGALFGSMTVGENVALPLREHTKLEDSTIEIMLRLKLEQVGLEGFEYYMPSQLSGCMKKRAAVARAMAMDPEILFFDEPSAGLDPIIAAGIDHLILELKQAFRMTIVVVTHELASAYLIADRMVLIDKGHVVAMGTTAEMRGSTQPRVRQFLDRVPEPEVAREMDYLQMLTQERRLCGAPAEERGQDGREARADFRGFLCSSGRGTSDRHSFCHFRGLWREREDLSCLLSVRRRARAGCNGPLCGRPQGRARGEAKHRSAESRAYRSGFQRGNRSARQKRQPRQNHEHEPLGRQSSGD